MSINNVYFNYCFETTLAEACQTFNFISKDTLIDYAEKIFTTYSNTIRNRETLKGMFIQSVIQETMNAAPNDEERLRFLAIFAKKIPKTIINEFHQFEAKGFNSKQLFPIMLILAKKNPVTMIHEFPNYCEAFELEHQVQIFKKITEKAPSIIDRLFNERWSSFKTTASKILDSEHRLRFLSVIAKKAPHNLIKFQSKITMTMNGKDVLELMNMIDKKLSKLGPAFNTLDNLAIDSKNSTHPINYLRVVFEHPEIRSRLDRIIHALTTDKLMIENQYQWICECLIYHILSDRWETWKNDSIPPKLELPFFLGSFVLTESSKEMHDAWSKTLKSASHLFNDRIHKIQLMSFLIALHKTHSLTKAQQGMILKEIFYIPLEKPRSVPSSTKNTSEKKARKNDFILAKKNHDNAYINKLILLTTLMNLDKESGLAMQGFSLTLESLQTMFKNITRDFFGTEHTEQFIDTLLKFTEKLRAGRAIFTYFGILNLNLLEKEKKAVALETFKQCCKALINNKYSTWRNNTEHLKKIREKGFDHLIDEWSRGKSQPLHLKNKEGWSLVDTDDFSDLALIGDETGGCLKLDGGMNRHYLLGYLADGKIRLYGIKDKEEKLIARHLVRLLWDKINKKPVLLLDKFYSLNGTPYPLKMALLEFIVERAKELNLTLVQYDPEANFLTRYKGEMQSFSTQGPLEYVDTLYQILGDNHAKTGGIYSIPGNKCIILNDVSNHTGLEQRKIDADRSLCIFWGALPDNIKTCLKDDPTAAQIRTWMEANKDKLKQITHLNLARAHYLESNEGRWHLRVLPKEIKYFTQLQTFDLSSNYIRKIPKEIRHLTHLKSLNLFDNKIYKIPEEIRYLTQLQKLELSYNNIRKIPEEIKYLKQLKHFRLSRNKIHEIPTVLGNLSRLKTLDLSNNKVREIPENLGNLVRLKRLNLEDNTITKTPTELGNLAQLEYLNLSGNKFSSYPPPEELSNLKNLKGFYYY